MRRRDFLGAAAGAAAAPFLMAAKVRTDINERLPALPAGFVFGASTSAYQIEGAVAEDGRGQSIWDTYSHQPGHIATGETGDIACDHYHRYQEDVALLAHAGFGAYRFSTAWPRIQADGTGKPNPKGLAFYDRLVDELLERRIDPYLTLFHWDLPQALQDKGGWRNRETAHHFADYARLMARHFGDRVKHWAMFNEPSIHAIYGHTVGGHAPGLRGWDNYLYAQHHQNLAQGLGLIAVRAERADLSAGTVLALQPVHPATATEEDRAAAKRFDAVLNRANLDPLFKGHYPELLAADFAPLVKPGDLAAIHQPIDFLGINYYSRAHAVNQPGATLQNASYGAAPEGTKYTSMGWPVEPDGLTELLVELRDHYGNPNTIISENGAAYDDTVDPSGGIQDTARLEFIREHIVAGQRAIEAGCRLRGYFVWSLLDNFEWAEGTRRRFGLVHVDFATLQRTPKASYDWMSKVMAANRENRVSRI